MHHHNQTVTLLSARDQTLNIFRDVQHLVPVPALTRSAEDRTVPGWKRHLGQRPSRAQFRYESCETGSSCIILLGSCAYELVYISHVMEIWQADNRRKRLAKVTTHAREDTDSPTFTATQNMMHMYKRNRFCETDSIVMRNDENKALCMERLLASCCFLLLCTFTACHCLYSKCLELLGQAT